MMRPPPTMLAVQIGWHSIPSPRAVTYREVHHLCWPLVDRDLPDTEPVTRPPPYPP